jgi:DnaK suppressor protein
MARKDALLRLHSRLTEKRDALRKKIAAEFDLTLEQGARGGDVVDAASDGEQIELNSQLAAMESRELRQVERAIELIREGRYGICEGCDHAIPVARLQALPYTLVCVECQRTQEASGGGDGSLEADWESAYEHEGRLEDREYSLGDLDIDG